MLDDIPDEIKTRAAELVTKAADQADDRLSRVEFGFVVDALAHDLGAVSDRATLNEN
jgi:hypothetical protein